ncbi:hypothetical protein V3C99_008032 [Haemonchus contortus]
MHVLFLISIFGVSLANGAICEGENVTTYLRSEGTRLMEFAIHSIKNVTLNMCANACSTNTEGHECSSFEYDARSQECSIHAEDGQPFGASVLTKTSGPVAFFQQVCVRGDALCSTPYGFERYPQSLLIGHAMKVVLTEGLSECLSRCLAAPASLHTQCRSAMFFYETGECIINRERRSDWPELFIDGVQDQLVDYFENNCQDVHCFNGQLHWIRTEEYFINHDKDVTIESMSLEECKAVCEENLVGTEKFPCRAFVYNAAKKECHLTADAGYTGRRGSSFNLKPISSGEYFEKYCLQVPIACLEASYEQVPDRTMTSKPYKEFSSTSVHNCLAICLQDGVQCAAAVFNYEKDRCSLSETSQFSHPELFVKAENMDYFDKICDPVVLAKQRTESSAERDVVADGVASLALEPNEQHNVDDRVTSLSLADVEEVSKATESVTSSSPSHDFKSNVVERKEALTEGIVIDDTADFLKEQKSPVKARLTTECLTSGVTVKVEFASKTSGAIYIKEKFATCHTEFTNATQVELHIPFPRSDEPDPRCPGIEIAPSLWSFSVVIQKNEINAPSLVTSVDRVFNVTCNFIDHLGRNANVSSSTNSGTNEVTSSKIEMQILREGRPVTTVPLGDEVELRWRILEPTPGLGYFIDNCIAERVGGTPPHPEPLGIIQRGCPDERINNRLIKSPIRRESDGFSTKMKAMAFLFFSDT